MKEVGFAALVLLFLIFVAPLALAAETSFKIKTFSFHEVQATAYDSDAASFTPIDKYRGTTNEYGDINFTLSIPQSEYNLIIYIKNADGERVMEPQKFLELSTDEAFDERIAPSWFNFVETPVEESNETITEENSTVSNEITSESDLDSASGDGITGATVTGKNGILSKAAVYSIGIIILLGVLGLGGYMAVKHRHPGIGGKSEGEIKAKKISEIKKEAQDKIEDYRDVIEDAEKKIRDAQEEIRRVKNQDRVREMEKKLKEDQARLERLREGKEE